MTLSSLIQKLESAEAGSRELDARIWCGIVRPQEYEPESLRIVNGNLIRSGWNVPAYTTDLNAIVALVEEKVPRSFISISLVSNGFGLAAAKIRAFGEDPTMGTYTDIIDVEAKTPALALCIALCSAVEAARRALEDAG